MDILAPASKGILIALAAVGYAAATFFMKNAAAMGELASVGFAMLTFQLVVIVEIFLLRSTELSNAYVMIIAAETLMIIAISLWFGEVFSMREMLGGGLVLAGLILVSE